MMLGEAFSELLRETLARQRAQVLDIVPLERWSERLPLSNSLAWNLFHTARHAELALRIVSPESRLPDAAAVQREVPAGGGLQEVQQPWFDASVGEGLADYNAEVFARVGEYLRGVDEAELDRTPLAAEVLDTELAGAEGLEWLRAQWNGRPVSLFVQWPLTVHLAHHVGEAITYRNQMGLSPFR